nr:MAG TPA: Origin of replication binding protein [Caudoviricetes sp.]
MRLFDLHGFAYCSRFCTVSIGCPAISFHSSCGSR